MMKINSKIFRYINKLTACVFFYSVIQTSLPNFLTIRHKTALENNIVSSYNSITQPNHSQSNIQENLSKKIYLDLSCHKILNIDEENIVTQISINKEGHILGYKSSKLKIISYPLEKQLMNLLNKNISLGKDNKNIYWLNITNKY